MQLNETIELVPDTCVACSALDEATKRIKSLWNLHDTSYK